LLSRIGYAGNALALITAHRADVANMAVLCTRCKRINPTEAAYCYFDGVTLHDSSLNGPLNLAQAPFITPFQFPSGQVCANFDQLALSCHALWTETWELLQNGTLASFLGGLGRADLTVVAAEAVAAGERDHGVDSFLARLPACNLAPPRLRVTPVDMQLGTLRPQQELVLELALVNEGHRLIVGSVTSNCNWLEVDGAADRRLAVQFAHEYKVRMRVVANRLAAGTAPRAGKILVQTNAGYAEVTVSCLVPVLPFPEGVLAGCRSPRELAKQARRFPDEAAALFAAGMVQVWYTANGWTYPVEGAPASGKAAVQQFFEALGLTEPPLVVLDTAQVVLCGAPGRHLQKKLRLHTDDKRPIYAFGRSLSPWLSVVETTATANRATITVEANVPVTTATQLETYLEVRANGNQRFHVPVALHIVDTGVDVSSPNALATRVPAAARRRSRLVKALIPVHGFALLATIAAALLLWLLPVPRQSAIDGYAAAISASTCMVLEVNLDELEEARGLQAEGRQLRKSIALWLQDLDLQPRAAHRMFVAVAPGARPLFVWTFDQPVRIDRPAPRRFKPDAVGDGSIYVDHLDPPTAWAVDPRGRLVSGAPEDVRAVLRRERLGRINLVDLPLARAVPVILPGAVAWAAGDVERVGTGLLRSLLASDVVPTALNRFQLQIVADANNGLLLRGGGVFPSEATAIRDRERLRAMSRGSVPALPALDLGELLQLRSADWPIDNSELRVETNLVADRVSAFVACAGAALEQAHGQRQTSFRKREYKEDLQAARAALESGAPLDDLFAARSRTNALKDSPFADADWFTLDRDVSAAEERLKLHRVLKTASPLTGRDDAGKLIAVYERACEINPGDAQAVRGLEAAKRVRVLSDMLRSADDQLRAERAEEAHRTLLKILKDLQNAAAPWDATPLKEHRERLLQDTGAAGRRVYAMLKESAVIRCERANVLRKQKKLPDAAAECDQAGQWLGWADAMVAGLMAADSRLGPDRTEASWVKAQLAVVAAAARAARSDHVLAFADSEIVDAESALKRAPENPRSIRGAVDKLQAAVKALESADAPDRQAAAGRLATLNALRADFARLLRPIRLDTGKAIDPTDWKYDRDHWLPGRTSDTSWLQAQSARPVTLQSTSRPWPAEFTLEMEFALTNGYGAIRNDKWIYYTNPDPLTIVLEGPRGKRTAIALGKDATCHTYDEARIVIGKEPQRLDAVKDLAGTQPIRLVLRAEGYRDGVATLTVRLNDREVRATQLAGPVHSVQLCAANPGLMGQPRWFVVIYRLEVAWAGMKGEKVALP
jgi:hypothetical protein